MQSRFIQYFTRNPKYLFLTDASGALVTAISWFAWKIFFADQFQFHSDVLSGLIFYAIALFSASLQFYLFAKKDIARCINFLVFGNVGFVIILINLLCFFWNEISILPRIYMMLECLIVSTLVYAEIKVKQNIRN
jgi:hypothetical protein